MKMKKMLCVVVSLVMVFALFPISGMAVDISPIPTQEVESKIDMSNMVIATTFYGMAWRMIDDGIYEYIIKITSVEELAAHFELHNTDEFGNEHISSDIAEGVFLNPKYNAEFFRNQFLLLVATSTPHGGIELEITSIYSLYEDTSVIYVEESEIFSGPGGGGGTIVTSFTHVLEVNRSLLEAEFRFTFITSWENYIGNISYFTSNIIDETWELPSVVRITSVEELEEFYTENAEFLSEDIKDEIFRNPKFDDEFFNAPQRFRSNFLMFIALEESSELEVTKIYSYGNELQDINIEIIRNAEINTSYQYIVIEMSTSRLNSNFTLNMADQRYSSAPMPPPPNGDNNNNQNNNRPNNPFVPGEPIIVTPPPPTNNDVDTNDNNNDNASDVDTDNSEISVYIDGVAIVFDVPPMIVNDRVLVPFRAIFEALGMEVEWDNDARSAIGMNDDVIIEIPIGSLVAIVNDETVELDVAAMLYNERTFVPLRFVAENSGANVEWRNDTRTVLINMDR